MKSTLFLSSLGSLLGVAAASHAHHMHHDAHEALLERALAAESTSAANATDGNALCGCTTQIMTYFGEPMRKLACRGVASAVKLIVSHSRP